MVQTIIKGSQKKLAIIIFLILSIWWIFLQFNINGNDFLNQFFGGLYGIVALLGGLWGTQISRSWGGIKSVMGRSILMFSLGLFAQEFGQLSYWYYVFYKHVDIPYPSIGDIGYFISIPFYIYGVYLLAQASGVKFSIKSVSHKIQAVLIPIGMLIFSYLIFLQGYSFDWSKPLNIFLDFGYPFGEAIYISFALLAFLFSRNVLGGVMKYRIFLVLLALVAQYMADFTFLYQAKSNTFQAGGINDYMYLISYFVMTFALLELNVFGIKKNLGS